MKCVTLAALLFICCLTQAQTAEIDSLKNLLAVTEDGPKRVNILEGLSYTYLSSSPDTALKYALQGLQLAKDIGHRKGEAICINALGNVYFHIGDNAKALEYYLEYLKIKEELKEKNNISIAYYNISAVYTEEKDYKQALFYLSKALQIDKKVKDSAAILYDAYSLASNYQRMQRNDSALFYINQSYNLAQTLNDEDMMGAILNTYGEIYLGLNDSALALKYYRASIPYAAAVQDDEVIIANYYGLSKILKKTDPDSAIFYSTKALNIARQASFFKQVLEISGFATELFKERKQFDSAFYYQQLSIATKDSLFNTEQLRKVQDLKFSEQQRQQAIETARLKLRSTIKLFIVIFTAITFLVIAILLWRNNKRVSKTLQKLRATQAQLIQSEKMASLGELTAGIAHEIQNPLNFVNNFSEVNNELIEELNNENDINEIKVIANDIKQNNEKILLHGKRADAIVKSMLQHSRKSSGQREETDINNLCDEYLRLSYYGLLAKNKNFTAELKTNFDDSIEKINIVPEDIGRVLLNLFNNAFYAVNEKKKLSASNYQPIVEVKTYRTNNAVEITVSDNGNGIPANIISKIFQPFFTTKPTGEGTGLGLSLAYDIITKEHNGTIKAESKENEGTNFIATIPV
ncbi:MAG TPA: tetratricopeptide repeat protein [Parafilimonas sp.]|nr:tetratricopeptide repeat protein [Parafilimonas sp.]